MIEAREITVRIGTRALVDAVSTRVEPGTLTVVVGPNGAGKSTLLRCLTGERSPDAGEVTLEGRALEVHTPRALARKRAVLSQRSEVGFAFTALEVVLLGRTPWGDQESSSGRRLAAELLGRVGLARDAHTPYGRLSGGEQQRVHFARVLAQLDGAPPRARYLLLDEPSTHLDPGRQHEALRLCRALCDEGAGVLAVLHELSLAAKYADRVLLMSGGKAVAQGATREVLVASELERAYQTRFRVVEVDGVHHPLAVGDPVAAA